MSSFKLLSVATILFASSAFAQTSPGELSTGFSGSHSSRGTFVDLTAARDLQITSFALHLVAGPVTIQVYTKSGATTQASTTTSGDWTLHDTVDVEGNGAGVGTGMNITPFSIGSGQTVAFYLVADTDGTLLNSDLPPTSASNADLTLASNYESHGLFSSTYNGWGFLGTVCFDGGDCGAGTIAPPVSVPVTSGFWTLLILAAMLLFLARRTLIMRRD